MQEQWNHKIFNVTAVGFDTLALEIFRFQHTYNPVYRAFSDQLGVNPAKVREIRQIPCLPIRFFKTHAIRTGVFEPAVIFESSGTTGTVNSRHEVFNTALYEESFNRCFELFYGDISNFCVLGLLPSYLERGHSSLVYMVDHLVKKSGHPRSGFYLHNYEGLAAVLQELEAAGQKTLLIGVTYALLDLAEQFPMPLQHSIVMETGGMKGRRKELVRAEVHERLRAAFQLDHIHSEYGMTELLSQGYSAGDGIFDCPPWMRILLRDEEDPLHVYPYGSETRAGAINVIDLANVYSCSFIATDDAGRIQADGKFEVLGRLDNSDLRGCSLMLVN